MKRINNYLKYSFFVLIIICICYSCYCCFIKSPIGCYCCCFKSSITTVILVRHADRTGTIDQLNSNGIARAQELARVLDEAGISAIYSSDANRAQQTAAPLATQLGINISIYNTSMLSDLADDILTNHKGEVILVVGHSNTVPTTIGLLGVSPVPADIADTEFDNMFIVSINKRCNPRVIKMEYGLNTP